MFSIAKHHQLFLYHKDYYKIDFHWCSCLYLLLFVLSILRCTLKLHKFWFCADDMNCYVRGTKHRYVVDRLVVSLIWPMQKRTKLSHIEVKALEKQVLFSINNNLSFLKIYLLGRILFQLIKQLMQCHGPKHLSCQNYTTIGGRLVSFLWPFSSHHWRFFSLGYG